MYHNTLQQFALVTDGAGAFHGGRQKTKVTRKKEVELKVEEESQFSDERGNITLSYDYKK